MFSCCPLFIKIRPFTWSQYRAIALSLFSALLKRMGQSGSLFLLFWKEQRRTALGNLSFALFSSFIFSALYKKQKIEKAKKQKSKRAKEQERKIGSEKKQLSHPTQGWFYHILVMNDWLRFLAAFGRCYLKTSDAGRIPKSGAVSGSRDCRGWIAAKANPP